MLINLVADYGSGDLAFAEVSQRLLRLIPEAQILLLSVRPFDTIGAGFMVAQLALGAGPEPRLIFHNVAPRFDDDDPRHRNAGEGLAACLLDNGVTVVGVLAGESFSFLADAGHTVYHLEAPTEGSQFRSRDFFPLAAAELVQGRLQVGNAFDPGHIPPVPDNAVLYSDGYGNLKTSWCGTEVRSGERVLVRIGEVHSPAVVSDGTFHVGQGELAFAPGSSGWERPGGPVRWYELFLRGGSAAERFRHPRPGTPVEILPLN